MSLSLTAVSRALSPYGPFFALDVFADPAAAVAQGAVRVAGDDLDRLLAQRIARTQAAVGSPDRRASASLVHLDLVSRLLSPALGAAVGDGADGRLLPLTPGATWCRTTDAGVRFGIAEDGVQLADAGGEPTTAAKVFADTVLPTVERVTAAVEADTPLPRHVRRSNVASAVGGAVTVVAAVGPHLADRARGLFGALLDGDLADGGRLVGSPPRFVRNGCCLYYRLPAGRGRGGLCGDCILATRAPR